MCWAFLEQEANAKAVSRIKNSFFISVLFEIQDRISDNRGTKIREFFGAGVIVFCKKKHSFAKTCTFAVEFNIDCINALFSHHIVLLPCEPEWLCKPIIFNGNRILKDGQCRLC